MISEFTFCDFGSFKHRHWKIYQKNWGFRIYFLRFWKCQTSSMGNLPKKYYRKNCSEASSTLKCVISVVGSFVFCFTKYKVTKILYDLQTKQ